MVCLRSIFAVSYLRRLRPWAAQCALLVATAAGCHGESPAPPTPPATAAPAAAPAVAAPAVAAPAPQPALAEVPSVGTEARPAGLRLRIAAGRLALGDTVISLEGFAVPAAAARGMLITPLFDALLAEYDSRRAAEARAVAGAEPAGRLVLSIAPDAPYGLVTRALYTAGQAQFDDLSALVMTADGERVLPLPLPRIGVADPDDDTWSCGDLCSSAETSVHAAGVQVIARQTPSGDGLMLLVDRAIEPVFADGPDGEAAELLKDLGAGVGLGAGGVGLGAGESAAGRDQRGRGPVRPFKGPATPAADLGTLFGDQMARSMATQPARPEAQARPGKPPPPARPPTVDWRGALMLSGDGICPSVPRKDGRIDRAALTALLKAVYAIEPGCTRATVGAASDVPWQDVADAMQVHRALSHVPVMIAADAQGATAECVGGMRPPARATPQVP